MSILIMLLNLLTMNGLVLVGDNEVKHYSLNLVVSGKHHQSEVVQWGQLVRGELIVESDPLSLTKKTHLRSILSTAPPKKGIVKVSSYTI